ncbi:BON domain-containing protein [Erythrobacter litoralis]|uniref:BON domain-containing protein n=1 Tax=Erythrobacter litoralis TaxID=39960 RepID=UPI001F21E3D1|nr:BON domain-containing protein [Erythrobacter litoralis]
MANILKSLAATWLLFAVASPAHAVLPGAPEGAAEPASTETQAIEQSQDAGTDSRIRGRIEGIFAELPAFADVEVTVSDGVVTLSGTVPDEADIERAENIVGRINGVVTIENGLERDLSVDGGIGALEDLTERGTGLIELAPLLLAALIVAAAIGAIGYLIAGFGALWRRIAPNVFLAEVLRTAIRFIFVIAGLVIALDMLGAGALLGAVLGGAGVIGLALGFAMRDTVENYVASLFLSLRQPFRANDHVVIDDKEGRVIRLTSRATILMTLEGNHLRIPNSQVFKAIILNYTTNPNRRFEFEMGIDADDDADAARALGRQTLGDLPFVLSDPPPEARTEAVGDSNIVIKFLGWVDQREADWHKARSRAIAAVKVALEDGGFGLPEPIYRLRFDPRTGPLPFENIEKTKGSEPAPTPPPAKAATAPVEEDVSATDEIAQMVEKERQGEADDSADLLDSSKPSEY